jgi:hypothetical protein
MSQLALHVLNLEGVLARKKSLNFLLLITNVTKSYLILLVVKLGRWI